MTPQEFLPKMLQKKRITLFSETECTLNETDKSAKLRKVLITGLSTSNVLLATDQIRGLDNLLTKGNGLKQSDYLLLTEYRGKKRAVYFELKSTSFKEDHYVEQFRGVECICDYLDSVAARFHKARGSVAEFAKHFVVLHKLPISKATTKLTKPPKNNDPASALEFYVDSSNTVDLREILFD